VTGKSDIELYSNTRIEEIECDRKTKKYRIILAENSAEKRTSVLVDGIVFATGYKNFGGLENQEPIHPILETIVPDIHFRDDGGPEVQRDYRLKTKNPSLPPVYLNGLCESSHGFGDAGSFSLLSVRSDVIAVSLSEHLQKSEDDRKAQMPEVEAHV
jgi:L-ornithine N5-oxygenase